MDGFYAARASTNDGASLDGFVTALHTGYKAQAGRNVVSLAFCWSTSGAASTIAGVVSLVEHVGAESVVAVKLSHAWTAHDEEGSVPGEIMITVNAYSGLQPDDEVFIVADLSGTVLFSRTSGERLGAGLALAA